MGFGCIFVVGVGFLTLVVGPKKFFGNIYKVLVVTGLLVDVLDWVFRCQRPSFGYRFPI